jgi:predicted kinase
MVLFLPAPTDRSPVTRLILMCGLPGSGKTTRAQKLAARLSAVRFSPDEWLTGLGLDIFDEPQRDRLEQVLWRHTLDLLRLGQSVILEYGFWTRAERDEKREAARALGAHVHLDYVDVPFDELVRRVEARSTGGPIAISAAQMATYRPYFQAPDAAELALFDPADYG